MVSKKLELVLRVSDSMLHVQKRQKRTQRVKRKRLLFICILKYSNKIACKNFILNDSVNHLSCIYYTKKV